VMCFSLQSTAWRVYLNECSTLTSGKPMCTAWHVCFQASVFHWNKKCEHSSSWAAQCVSVCLQLAFQASVLHLDKTVRPEYSVSACVSRRTVKNLCFLMKWTWKTPKPKGTQWVEHLLGY
jgi:hypothetical protein